MEEKSGNGAFLIILIALFIGGFPWLGFALIALIIFIFLLLKIFEILFRFLAFIVPLLCSGIIWIRFAIRWFFMILRGLFLEVVKFFKKLFKVNK